MCLGEAGLAGNQGPIGRLGTRGIGGLLAPARPENRGRMHRAHDAAWLRAGTSDSARIPRRCPAARSTPAARRFARHSRPSPPDAGGNRPGGRCTRSSCKPARRPRPGGRLAAAESPTRHLSAVSRIRPHRRRDRLDPLDHDGPGRRQLFVEVVACVARWTRPGPRSRYGRSR